MYKEKRYKTALYWVKKLKSLEFLKSYECRICGENNIVTLCFHHVEGNKENKISTLLNGSFKKIKNELIKCEVLCQNCHQELHSKKENFSKLKINKVFFTQFLEKEMECELCKYNKCIDCLNFHHLIPDEKTIEFRSFRKKINDVSDISDHVKNELKNCQILCRNCHSLQHSEFFFKNKDLILMSFKNFKEINLKLPVDVVVSMFENGKRKIDISKHFNCSKGTITDILKRYYLKKEKEPK